MFIKHLIKEVQKDDVMGIANELTYKLVLAMFPFIIFLMTLIAYLSLDIDGLMQSLQYSLPADIYETVRSFVSDVVLVRRPELLSFSIIVAIFSASSGFNSVIRGLNKAYEVKENRGFIAVRLLSILLVFLFTFVIVVSVIGLVLLNTIQKYLLEFGLLRSEIKILFHLAVILGGLCVLLVLVMVIYKLSSAKFVLFKQVFPGALAAVLLWVVASQVFSIYINNFSRYSYIYGSIGSIFILLIWLNVMSFILILGGEINALIEKERYHIFYKKNE